TRRSVERVRLKSPVKPTTTSHFLPHEDMEFHPKQLVRTGTSWSDYSDDHHKTASDYEDSDAEPDGPSPGLAGVASLGSKLSYHLPEIKSVIENSPIEMASYRNIFFEARPRDRNSLSAQLQHLMAEGEGKALHNAAKTKCTDATDEGNRLSFST